MDSLRDELTRRLKLWGEREQHALRNMQPLRRIDIYRENFKELDPQ